MTEKGGDQGRGNNIWKYILYSNIPSTGGRELKGGGNKLKERKGFNLLSHLKLVSMSIDIYNTNYTLTIGFINIMLLKIIGGVTYEKIKQVKEGRYIKINYEV